MAFIEMTCTCTASFQADVEETGNESLIILWAQQFISGHQQCGYMSQIKKDPQEKTQRYDVMYKERDEEDYT
jgi:hypothetical protein